MTLPASGTISLNDIKAEFGATGTRSLTDFYRGGAFAPNTPANAGVPTSGAIDLQDFYGASNQSVSIGNATVQAIALSPADATATYTLNSNGQIQRTLNGSTTSIGTWLLGGSASDFEVLATLSSGTLTSGVTGTRQVLSTSRSWSKTNTSNTASTQTCVLTLGIYVVGAGSPLDTASITLEAVVDV